MPFAPGVDRCEHVFVSSVVCVLLPRFELAVAAGARTELLQEPAALAPEPGRDQLVGEVSASAEAFGIHPGKQALREDVASEALFQKVEIRII